MTIMNFNVDQIHLVFILFFVYIAVMLSKMKCIYCLLNTLIINCIILICLIFIITRYYLTLLPPDDMCERIYGIKLITNEYETHTP